MILEFSYTNQLLECPHAIASRNIVSKPYDTTNSSFTDTDKILPESTSLSWSYRVLLITTALYLCN